MDENIDNNDTAVLLPEEDAETVERPSRVHGFVRVVSECTNQWEKFLLCVGVLAAVGTGFTQPLMSYTFGETAQIFVTITAAINNQTIDPEDLKKAYENFAFDISNVAIHFCLCGISFFAFGFIQFSLFKYVGDNTTYRLRKRYFKHLLKKDIEYFDNFPPGHFSTIINDNFERFREVFNEKIALIVSSLTDFIIGTTLAFYFDWRLASYGSVFALGLALSGLVSTVGMMSSTEKQNKHYAKAGSIAFQALGAFKTVISLNGQGIELAKYTKELKDGEQYGKKRAFLQATARGLCHFFCNALNGTILYFGADLIYHNTLDLKTIVTLFHFMLFSAISLGDAFPQISALANAIESIVPITEALNDDNSDIEKDSPTRDDYEEMEGVIKFDNVRFSYPTRPEVEVLKGVSFEVNKGECVAIVGASGSGKSTIVQLLLHYYKVDSGLITIDGNNVNDIQKHKLRRNIGLVAQEPILFQGSIEQNIKFGMPQAAPNQINNALRKAHALNFTTNMPEAHRTNVGERGVQLSGGQKQRVAIARVLIKEPNILVLDEATSALDVENERLIQDMLEEVSRETTRDYINDIVRDTQRARSTIIIAHRLSTIRKCSKIIVLKDGQIAEVGSHDELVEKEGAYMDLIKAQLINVSNIPKNPNPRVDIDEIPEAAKPFPGGKGRKSALTKLKADMNDIGAKRANMFQILKHCGPDWFILILAIVGSGLQGLNFPVLAQLITRCYRAYAMEGEDIIEYGHYWASMFMVFGLVRPLTQYCQYYFFGVISEKLSTRLRIKSFKHLLSVPCAFYDTPKNSPIRLASRLNAAPTVKSAVDPRLGSVLMTTVSFIVATTVATYYCYQLTIQVVLLFPMWFLAKFLHERTTNKSVSEDWDAFEDGNRVAVEAFENMRTVRSLNMEKHILKRSFRMLIPIKMTYSTRAIHQGLANGFAACCSQFVYAISLTFGAYLILNKTVLPMDMFIALITLSYSSNLAGTAFSYIPDYRRAVHAAGLIFNLLSYPATMVFDIDDGVHRITDGCISAEEIKFAYPSCPKRMLLNRVNLAVRPGRTVALVGQSGSGKSTIVALMQRFYTPIEGLVQVDNRTVEDVTLHHLRSTVAVVSQEPTLFNCTIRENLIYGVDFPVSEEDITAALQTANAFNFVSQFPLGVDTPVGERGIQLSGGQKQRIAIARAILRKPMILLLDEATSSLDAENEKLVQTALDNVKDDLTTLIVAHRLSTIVNSDLIAVLRQGKIIERGRHLDLLKLQGTYLRLVQLQTPDVKIPRPRTYH